MYYGADRSLPRPLRIHHGRSLARRRRSLQQVALEIARGDATSVASAWRFSSLACHVPDRDGFFRARPVTRGVGGTGGRRDLDDDQLSVFLTLSLGHFAGIVGSAVPTLLGHLSGGQPR